MRLASAAASPPAVLGPPEDDPDFTRFPQPVVSVTQAAFAYISRVDRGANADGSTGLGGNASHAAIMAREFCLPAVVGTGSTTTTIPDGSVVTVDPASGTVTIIDRFDQAEP